MKKYIFVIAVLLLFSIVSFGQEVSGNKKSSIIEVIDGVRYYIHFVKEGETLNLIAGIYEVAPSEITGKNPGLGDDLKAGQIIKIPYFEKEKKQDHNLITYEKDITYHIVRKQESLYGIAKKYGVKIAEIQALNPGLGEQINEGQLLKIPGNEQESTVKVQTEFSIHEVQPSETLYGISRKYGYAVGEIRDMNPGISDTIKTGQLIRIPKTEIVKSEPEKPAYTVKNYTEHKVNSGETLYSIARNYGVSLDSVYACNSGLSAGINPGQLIRIPLRKNNVEYISHTVRTGEKLQTISDKYQVTVKEIKEKNPEKGNRVSEGETILIPVDKNSLLTQKPDTIHEIIEKPAPETMIEDENPLAKVFNVALLIPFSLEEMDSLNPSDMDYFDRLSRLKSFRFIQFYEGFLMAADSLEKQGLKMNLFVYDVDNDHAKAEKVKQSPEIKRMDLIVGPFFNKSFTPFAELAKNYEINIVNPLSERDEVVKNNPYVFKMKPSPESQAIYAARHIASKYNNSNVLVVRANSLSYKNMAIQIELVLREKNFRSTGEDAQKLITDINYNIDHFSAVLNNLKKDVRNIIIIPTDDKVFSLDIISKLNQYHKAYDIILFGLPDWSEFSDIEIQHLHNLNFHTVVPAFIDYNDPGIIELIKKFRNKYNTEPQDVKYAFDGFDTGWFFLNAMLKYGHNFGSRISDIHPSLTQGPVLFSKTADDGYINSRWFVVKYENFKTVEIK